MLLRCRAILRDNYKFLQIPLGMLVNERIFGRVTDFESVALTKNENHFSYLVTFICTLGTHPRPQTGRDQI